MNAILRRANVIGESNEINAGGIAIDKAAHQVKIDDKEIELSFKEFELLTYFVENQGIALSREKILNNVWDYDYLEMQEPLIHMLRSREANSEKKEIISRQSGGWGTNLRLMKNEDHK